MTFWTKVKKGAQGAGKAYVKGKAAYDKYEAGRTTRMTQQMKTNRMKIKHIQSKTKLARAKAEHQRVTGGGMGSMGMMGGGMGLMGASTGYKPKVKPRVKRQPKRVEYF